MSPVEPSGPDARTELASLRAEVGTVRTAIEARVDAVSTDVQRVVEQALAQEAKTSESSNVAMTDSQLALESRLAVLEDTLDAMSERLEALARDGASTTTDRLAGLAVALEALERRLEEQGRASAEQHAVQLRDVVTALERTADEGAQTRAAVAALADHLSRR